MGQVSGAAVRTTLGITITHQSLIESLSPPTTYYAVSDKESGSSDYTRPVAPDEPHGKIFISEFHEPSWYRNMAGAVAAKS